MSNNVLPQPLPVSTQTGPCIDVLSEPNCNYQEALISERQDCNVMMQTQFVPNGAIVGSMDTTSKRKTPPQPMSHPQPLAVQNKRMVPNRAWACEISKGPKPASVSPKTQYLPAASLCKSASFSCSNKPGKVTTARKQVSLPLKAQSESCNVVRSKMRESLASALAMVQCQKEAKRLHSETVTNSVEGLVSEPESAASGVDVMVSNCGDISVQTEILTMAKTSDTEEFTAEELFPQANVSYSDNVLGNNLSWDLESDVEFTENSPNEMTGATANGGSQEKLLLDPKVLAFKIEAELFKLFGGVNKKYKEKGRSLLFNLKDKSNPKLREKVMYGEIAAERLCSMSAEELASKELAEWRQAKAEEMAQMVVLQDTEVDIRSLVRKTHKGEFQVEVEPMDSGSVEISVGSSSLNWSRPKNIKKKTPSITIGVKNELNNSSEGSALNNGVTVDDEMQAATGSLPSIVSLDEFMSSIVSPSESLSSDIGKGPSGSDNNDAEANIDLGTSPAKAEASLVKAESSKPYSDLKSVSIPAGELLWEGALQLSVSSVISVIGILKSGEKTTTEEWPMLLEIKGRVRLDAFEKFVRELPNSRSRAVMVMCFVCKEECSRTEHENISEVVDSYVKDERVGFAEPVSGVELYLCPNRGRTTEILSNIVPRNQLDFLKSLDDDGLIGVVVWRRPQLKKPPQSYSHKNQTTLSTSRYGNMPQVNHDDGGDVPPGFGPMAVARDDDDDLPEFNYLSRGDVVMNRTNRSDSVRELIHKYGKSEPSWNHGFNNSGDNVILPEWHPQPNPMNVNGSSMVRPRSEWWTHQGGGY